MAEVRPSRVVAVVLNYCRESLTAECVRALSAQQPPVTTLVVDNASPDGSGERLHAAFSGTPYLQTDANLGYAGGNARGIAWALARGAEYVFVINEDAEPASGCVAELVRVLDANSDAGVAVPTVTHANPPDVVWWAGGFFDPVRALGMHEHFGVKVRDLPANRRQGAPPREVEVFSGCAVLIRATTARHLGAFREDYVGYLEDTEMSLRWRQAGQRLLHVPSALVVHKTPFPPPEPTLFQIRMRDRNRRWIASSFLTPSERVRFHLWYWPTRAARALAYTLRGDWPRLRALLDGAFGR